MNVPLLSLISSTLVEKIIVVESVVGVVMTLIIARKIREKVCYFFGTYFCLPVGQFSMIMSSMANQTLESLF